jgi:hypothetical protein
VCCSVASPPRQSMVCHNCILGMRRLTPNNVELRAPGSVCQASEAIHPSLMICGSTPCTNLVSLYEAVSESGNRAALQQLLSMQADGPRCRALPAQHWRQRRRHECRAVAMPNTSTHCRDASAQRWAPAGCAAVQRSTGVQEARLHTIFALFATWKWRERRERGQTPLLTKAHQNTCSLP